MKDAYVMCRVCGGKGHYPKLERIGEKTIETPVWCKYCGGKGMILKSKLDSSQRKIVKRNRKLL